MMRNRTERDFVIEGLLAHLGRQPAESEIEAVQDEFAHTNIRSVAIDNGLARLRGETVEEYSAYRG